MRQGWRHAGQEQVSHSLECNGNVLHFTSRHLHSGLKCIRTIQAFGQLLSTAQLCSCGFNIKQECRDQSACCGRLTSQHSQTAVNHSADRSKAPQLHSLSNCTG